MATETYEIFAHDATTAATGLKVFSHQCCDKSIERTLISRTTHENYQNQMISDEDRGNPFTRSYRGKFWTCAALRVDLLGAPEARKFEPGPVGVMVRQINVFYLMLT